jgi:HK97 gp10 family phage protein
MAAPGPSQAKLTMDLTPFVEAMKAMDRKLRNKTVAKALDAGAAIVAHATRAGAPQESGLLAESIDIKRKTFPHAGTGYAVVGPLTSVAGTHKGKLRVPWRYHHLVELGKINRDGSFTPGDPFLKRATEATRPIVESVMVSVLGDAIAKAGDE